MLTDNMPLKKMLDFMPSDLDMAMLELDVVVYLKVSVVSNNNIDNYNFIRYLFSNDELLQKRSSMILMAAILIRANSSPSLKCILCTILTIFLLSCRSYWKTTLMKPMY